MNKLLKVSIGIGMLALVIITSSILIAGKMVASKLRQADALKTSIETQTQEAATGAVLNSAEVARHNTPSDCWMIISSKVYDLTPFIVQHPGGANTMTPYCGKDGTIGFETKDKRTASPHSKNAINMLTKYLVGVLGEPPQTKQAESQTTPTQVPEATPILRTNNQGTLLTVAEVAAHNTASNCWMIINSTVYNMTAYLTMHPGGAGVMTPFCGKDATVGFATKGKNPGSPHSQFAQSQLSALAIGQLGSTAQSTAPKAPAAPESPATSQTSSTPVPTSTGQLSAAEVATHNTASNCWMIINSNVYNVTPYLTMHPGGVNVITKYCGQNATTAFTTKDGKGSNHSSSAYAQLNQYIVGSTSAMSTVTTTTTGPTPTAPPTASGTLPQSVREKYPTASIISNSDEDDGRMELKINVNGECRSIKTNSSGAITEDKKC